MDEGSEGSDDLISQFAVLALYLIAAEEEEEGLSVLPPEPEAVSGLAAVLRGELGPHKVRRQCRCFGQQVG